VEPQLKNTVLYYCWCHNKIGEDGSSIFWLEFDNFLTFGHFCPKL